METTITVELLIQIGVMIIGFWGFYKVVKEIIKAITDRHDKETKWDEYETKMQNTELQIKEIKDEMKIQTECIQAILDGLIQLNCDGEVTAAKKRLDKHLNERAHD